MEELKQDKINTRKNSVKKNYILNVIYQIFVLIVPLVTTPYLSRILGAEGIGQYSFTSSLTNYFVLFAALGFGYYAQREIAKYQSDKHKQSIVFWEIIIVRFFSVSLSVLVCVILNLANIYGNYSSLMWWWIILICAQELDITFLFQGNEEFGKIVVRNVIVKVISVLMIFLFVKTKDDVSIYILCFAGSTFIGNISLWFYLPKFLCRVHINELKSSKHILPTIKLFIPTIATSVYTVLDKTLIGLLISDTYIVQETQIIDGVETIVDVVKKYSDLENGYYEQSEKIVKICMAVITSLGTVMIPRNSSEYSKGNIEKVKDNIYKSTNFVWFLGMPMMFGLAAISRNVIPWFLGDGYVKCIYLMALFTPLIIFIGLSNVFGLQYLIPLKKDAKFSIAIFSGAIINFCLNLLLIPFLWSYGAVIASLVAELSVTIVMGIIIHREISIKKILLQSIKYLVSGVIMFLIVGVTSYYMKSSIFNSIILLLEGIVTYFIILLIFKDRFFLNILISFKTIITRKIKK